MELQVGVKCFIRNKDNRFLFIKRADGPKIGMWDIPGGRIELMIPLFENLKREINEETKLQITKPPRLIFVQDIFHEGEKHLVRLTFLSDENILSNPTLSEEHSDFIWLDKNKALILEGLDPLIKEVLETLV